MDNPASAYCGMGCLATYMETKERKEEMNKTIKLLLLCCLIGLVMGTVIILKDQTLDLTKPRIRPTTLILKADSLFEADEFYVVVPGTRIRATRYWLKGFFTPVDPYAPEECRYEAITDKYIWVNEHGK